MLSRAYDLGKALLQVTAKHMNLSGTAASKYREILSDFNNVLHLLPPIIAIGRVWEHWQSFLSAGKRVTLSHYPEAVREIFLTVTEEKEAEARETSDEIARIISDMRSSICSRFGIDFPLLALAAELLDPATTHRANSWAPEWRPKVTALLFEWMNALAPPLQSSTGGKWGPVISSDGLENSRTASNWAELARVGTQLDVFNAALRASPERIKVVKMLPTPICYSVAL